MLIKLNFLVLGGSDVLSRINDLEHRFGLLRRGIISELEKQGTRLTDILLSVVSLPTGIKQEYKPAIAEIFPDLRKETTISELFYHLNPLVDFLSYGLLKHIIDEFGSKTLKKTMSEYIDDVIVFMQDTTVKHLIDHWPGQQETPPNFSKLRAKIDEDPTTYTLYRLDQLRRRYCCEHKLTELIFVIIGLDMSNSFIVEWLLPSAFVPQVIESARQIDLGFYLRECILKVVVGEKQLFPFLRDSKPKALALQPAAATVTVISAII